MLDCHVHIGQFNEVYYDPYDVFGTIENSVKKTSVTEIHYSSTSSCRDDVELSKIEEETYYAQQFKSDSLLIKPYLWFVPQYAENKITPSEAIKHFNYCGFKLHPLAQKWDFTNQKHSEALNDIFEIASEKNELSILIHCGTQECDRPKRFEPFFKTFPEAHVILAHSNPVEETIEMLRKYRNVTSDIAYADEKTIRILQKSDVWNKVLFGTDFPITHYFNTRLFNSKNSLFEEYIDNCKVNLH